MQRKWMTVSALLLALLVLASGCDMKKKLNAPLPSGAPLCVNEFLASNSGYGQDEFGEFDDWIEIYNRTDYAINLAGYGVTDNLTDQRKYVIPDGAAATTTIQPKGFLLIWCDGQMDQGPLHSSFKLSASGEQVGLYEPTGDALDELTFGPQVTDVSFGRLPDGGGTLQSLTLPTPGASNGTGTRPRP
jgi:hypothetical protein